jgi:hypothetical protein
MPDGLPFGEVTTSATIAGSSLSVAKSPSHRQSRIDLALVLTIRRLLRPLSGHAKYPPGGCLIRLRSHFARRSPTTTTTTTTDDNNNENNKKKMMMMEEMATGGV